MLRKWAIFISGIVMGALMLTALTWVLVGHWFTLSWWLHVCFVAVSFVVPPRIGLVKITKTLQQSGEEVIARILVGYINSSRTIWILYYLPIVIVQPTAILIFGYGLYRSMTYYSQGMLMEADLAIFLTWLLWLIILSLESSLNKARLFAERAFEGQDVSFHWPSLGRILERGIWFLMSLIFPIILILFGFVFYAFILSDSLELRYYAVVIAVGIDVFARIITGCNEISKRLQAPPVLLSKDVTWEVPTGLILRSFVDESDAIGEQDSMLRPVAEQMLSNRNLGLGWTGRPLRWLTALRPGQHLVSLGVQRVLLANEEWQVWISNAISRTELVVILLGKTPGLEWEVRECIITGNWVKLRFIVLPQVDLDTREHVFALLRTMYGDNLKMPRLPLHNPEIVAFWWEQGILREQRPIPIGWRGMLSQAMLALGTR